MKKTTYIITGLLIAIAIGALYFGINFLKSKNVFNTDNEYYVVYERIDGLQIAAPVLINGFKIGQVRNIVLMPDRSGKLLVTIALNENFAIPKGTIARIFSSDLMGTKAIEIKFGDLPEFVVPGDTLTADFEGSLQEMVSLQMAPLKSQAESLMKQMEEAITAIEYIFNDKTKQDIVESFDNIKKTFVNLEHSSVALDSIVGTQKNRIDRILSNIELITRNLNQQEQQINKALTNFSSLSDSLVKSDIKQTILKTRIAMTELSDLLKEINEGKGTIGQLVVNDSLYQNLEDLTYSLTLLSNDIQSNPKRYAHFSAFDWGKTVYVAQDGTPIKKGKLVYKIELMRSENEISLDSSVFKGYQNIEIYNSNGIKIYLYQRITELSKAKQLLNQVKGDFPNATIVEFKGDILVRTNVE